MPSPARRRVEVPELAGQPLLVYERRSSTYRLVERALLEASIFPRIVMEIDHLGAVASMVRAGLGLAIVPRWAVADDLAAGRLVGLVDREDRPRLEPGAWDCAPRTTSRRPYAPSCDCASSACPRC